MKKLNIFKKKEGNKTSSKEGSKNRFIYYILLSLILTAIYFYTTRHVIFSVVLLAINLLFFFLLVEKKYLQYFEKNRRTHQCISFINNYILNLSITQSPTSTFEQLKDSYSGRFKEELDNLSGLEIEAQLESLKSYFNLNLYDFFVKMMHQYIFNGGDILNISQMLIFDSRRLESTLDDFNIVAKRKLIEFATLWGITIIILVVVQLSLSMFYDTILEMSFYSGAIFGFFVVFLVFLYLILLQRFNLSFINENMEEKPNEQVKREDGKA